MADVSGISGNYSNIIGEVCEQHAKTLGNNYNSIFDAIQQTCNQLTAEDFTLGKLYSSFCNAISKIVTKITTAVAKFAYDLAAKFVNFFKKNDVEVPNKQDALLDSVTSMADSTKTYIPIGNNLGGYMMFNGSPKPWCASTVKTFYLGIPGISSELEEEIKDIHSVSGFQDWGKKKKLYTETSSMKNTERADYISNNVKPGDIMIEKRKKSHMGIVVEVYPDGYTNTEGKTYPPGSFMTVEGNTIEGLAYRIHKPDNIHLSGFIDMSSYLEDEDLDFQ